MTIAKEVWVSKEETVIRQAAKCWMCGYVGSGPIFPLTKDEQITGFAHAQSNNYALIKSQYITVAMESLRELDELTRLTRKPAFIVAMFSDYGVYIHTEAIKRPLDIRLVGKSILVHINSGQFGRLTYEAKW